MNPLFISRFLHEAFFLDFTILLGEIEIRKESEPLFFLLDFSTMHIRLFHYFLKLFSSQWREAYKI